jgi:hypothetical protein
MADGGFFLRRLTTKARRAGFRSGLDASRSRSSGWMFLKRMVLLGDPKMTVLLWRKVSTLIARRNVT